MNNAYIHSALVVVYAYRVSSYFSVLVSEVYQKILTNEKLNVQNPNHKSALGGDFAFKIFCADINS